MLNYLQKRQLSATQPAAETLIPSKDIAIDPDLFGKKSGTRRNMVIRQWQQPFLWPLAPVASLLWLATACCSFYVPRLRSFWFAVRNGDKSNLWHPSWLIDSLILVSRCMSSFQGTAPRACVPPCCSRSCPDCILRCLCWQAFACLSSNGAELWSSSHALHHLADYQHLSSGLGTMCWV